MTNTSFIKKYETTIFLLIFLILVTPTVLQPVKLVFILICVLLLFLSRKEIKYKVSRSVIGWFALYTLVNTMSILKGTLGNTSVLFQLLPSYVIWPLLYLILFVIPKVSINLEKVTTLALYVILGLFMYTFASHFIDLPFTGFISEFFPFVIEETSDFLAYFTPSISSLIFLVPFLLTIVYFGDTSDKKATIKKYVLLLLSLFIVFLTGRRALIGTIMIAIFLCILIDGIWIKKRNMLKIIVGIGIAVLVAFGLLLIFFPNSRILNIDASLIVQGDELRSLQFDALIDGWKQKPFFGHGYGVNTETIVRSQDVPGMYELTYVALLFQTGLVGFLSLMFLYGWLIYKLFRLSILERNFVNLAFTIGLTSVMIANATNPYIQSFDGMWFLFYGLMLVDRYNLNEKDKE
ncbi:O-antigen ligase family protein [Vagococcus elongatus]|uniref:O-antigen ligase-related domain-containing protein n=1 Tax=Vagococcus elongatus TaxID=180344 RepID=A0A430B4D5_9ENTE|nr:O-antigen ligase family protein [Vagococcus elongatus]RSU15062.1 hypothetical protein CBF29_01615 [Vagococcus elongatus]